MDWDSVRGRWSATVMSEAIRPNVCSVTVHYNVWPLAQEQGSCSLRDETRRYQGDERLCDYNGSNNKRSDTKLKSIWGFVNGHRGHGEEKPSRRDSELVYIFYQERRSHFILCERNIIVSVLGGRTSTVEFSREEWTMQALIISLDVMQSEVLQVKIS